MRRRDWVAGRNPIVRTLPKSLVRERLADVTRFVRVKGGGENAKRVPEHPPRWCVDGVYDRTEWPGVMPLTAVTDYPPLLPSGRILDREGYDPASGVYYWPPPGFAVDVPARPTAADRAAARNILLDAVGDFPFDGDTHRAAWLTPLARFAFDGPAPLFLADANVRSAGKGLSCDVIALILTGREFPFVSYTHDEDEQRKRVTAVAAAGHPLMLLDNLTGNCSSSWA